MQAYDVVIVGSGLSGMACAVELSERKQKVLVLEKRAVIGGRTSSWVEDGMAMESGLHRFLGFYEVLPRLLKKVGVELDDILYWEDEIEIITPEKISAVFGASLFKPLKTIKGALLTNDFLPPLEKAKLATFFVKGFLEFKKDPRQLDEVTVYEYAQKHTLSDETIHRVLVPLTEGLFFLSIKKYSALTFFALFSPYISNLQKTRVGAFKGGMTDVLMKPLQEYVEKNGGEILINASVEKLLVKEGRVIGIKLEKEEVKANHVVIATGIYEAQQLIHRAFKNDNWCEEFLRLPTMPSVTFQIELTEPALKVDRTTFGPGTLYSSFSEQSRTTFRNTKGRLSVILSDPIHQLDRSEKEILEDLLNDAKKLNVPLSKKIIKNYKKVIWEHDFLSYERGTYFKRPPSKTPIPGLILAGDYTDQKFLSTMEGAVASGSLAAQLVTPL